MGVRSAAYSFFDPYLGSSSLGVKKNILISDLHQIG